VFTKNEVLFGEDLIFRIFCRLPEGAWNNFGSIPRKCTRVNVSIWACVRKVSSALRAFGAGKDPMIPAAYCAMTD
jgi:hypothetical protein